MTDTIRPLRQRMIEDMNARKLCAGTQRGHITSCKRFAAFLKRSPDTATLEDIRRFQLHLAETGASICNRNRIMTGLRFLFRVTLRRLDLAAEIYHLREPQKIPLVMSTDETKRLLAVASSLKARLLLSLGYGCGLRAWKARPSRHDAQTPVPERWLFPGNRAGKPMTAHTGEGDHAVRRMETT
jgi:site-specific recombinase XerD